MGVLITVYCDNCERSTPALPWGRWPAGWCKVFFHDLGEKAMCSYQCLFEYAKRALDDPPTTATPMWPIDNPCPPLAGLPLGEVPAHLRYVPPERST
jgi:hypothetical protein